MKITGMWAVHEFMNSIPYLNMVVSTVLNFVPGCQVWCAALHNGMSTFVATGSLTAGFKVGAISAAAGYALQGIGEQFGTASDLNIADIVDAGNAAAEQAMIDSMVSFGGNMLTSGQVVAQIGAHAMVGGISAELQGGKFGHGFISAGVTKGAGGAFLPGGANLKNREIVRGTIISAAIGGTASALSGGKFANGAQMAAMQYLMNQAGESVKRQLACKGRCHGISGLEKRHLLNEEQTAALINGALSGTGATIAGIGCVSSGATCGLTVVLSADAMRQLTKAATGNDPLITLASDLGATDLQAANIALGTDFVTATMSINAAYKGLLMQSIQPYTAGTLGITSLDIFSTVNTVQQLNKAVESQ
ncbi:hypothetical protein [uncultured Shewanella sp.]|uniref:hypothetical protein n=1 Tax=uncultured Shewanella sp. TaxID=173975 RepID=UPI00261DC7E7|nr:hypothetical protein [uncultured Shewanella sp.]